MSKKPAYYYNQSGVIPFDIIDNELRILLITTSKRKRWIIPKGIIEPDLTSHESAAKEALEEAGIEGVVLNEYIGFYEYEKWDGICRVEVFPMRVTKMHDEWEESYRKREWFTLRETMELIHEKMLRDLIRLFSDDLLRYYQNLNIRSA